MSQSRIGLYDTLPQLNEVIELSQSQVSASQMVLGQLSEALSWMPVVYSQDGIIVGYAGIEDETIAERIARISARLWREGATRLARECLRFEEEDFGVNDDHLNLMLYSAHIEGALTLTVGWDATINLSSLRGELAQVQQDLINIVSS